MQANNKNSLIILILATSLSVSLLCLSHCKADDDTNIIKVCSKKFENDFVKNKCNQTLRSDENNNACGPDYDLMCMGKFVNTKATNATKYLRAVARNIVGPAAAPPMPAGGKPQKKSPAQTCVSSCNSAIDNLNVCKENWNTTLNKWIISNLRTYVSVAQTHLTTCEDDGFSGKLPDNLAAASNEAQALISVELAIANWLTASN